MVRKEQARWEADRGFEEHRYSDTCWRGFFEDTRAKRVYSHVEKVFTARGTERRTTPKILEYAREYFGARGSIFNLQHEHDRAARRRLYDALRSDGKRIRDADRGQLGIASMLTPERVQQAIAELCSQLSLIHI